MAAKPTYEQLQKRVKEFEKKLTKCAKREKTLEKNQERFLQLYERAPLAYQSLDEQGRL